MDLVAVNLHLWHQVFYFSVNPHFYKTFLANFFKQFPVMTFAAAHYWCKKNDLVLFKSLKYILYNFFLCPFHHSFTCIVTIRLSHSREQQSKEIIDLGYSTNCRSRVFIGRFLLN